MATRDVGIVGDGPAGSALAQALHRLGVDVVLIGNDRPWSATYTTWIDDLDGVSLLGDHDVWLHRFDSIAARFDHPLTIERSYGVLDNDRLRAVLRRDVAHAVETVAAATEVDARIVVDATGWPSGIDPQDGTMQRREGVSWQTAYGVVLSERPSGSLGVPTMMDFSDAPDRGALAVPTFAYSLPVADGWLVEETVLAGPPLEPDALRGRLASRLGLVADELAETSTRVERVRIPMGVPVPRPDAATVRFGAAAGMIHTATGYSVASSLRAADRVAHAIVAGLAGHSEPAPMISEAVWPRPLRRSRRLHDYGLDVLLVMDANEIRHFFETFFALPQAQWSAYLRIDTPPRDLASVMTAMFRRADWRLRRRLLGRNPLPLLHVLRP